MAQVAPEVVERRTMTPVENEPSNRRSSTQDRPKSKHLKSCLKLSPRHKFDLFELHPFEIPCSMLFSKITS